MEQIRFILSFVLFFFSCSKESVEVIRPEIDFLNNNYLSPAVVLKYKTRVDCNLTPYWEGQKMKLQGFVYSGNIAAEYKKFALYEQPNIGISPNESLEIKYQSKDSIAITKALQANKDKNCILQATCSTTTINDGSCSKVIVFTITKPEDIEFK